MKGGGGEGRMAKQRKNHEKLRDTNQNEREKNAKHPLIERCWRGKNSHTGTI